MNAPKKIWLSRHMDWDDVEKQSDDDIAYVRTDLVDGLANPLKGLAESDFGYDGWTLELDQLAQQIRIALKALDDAEIGRGME